VVFSIFAEAGTTTTTTDIDEAGINGVTVQLLDSANNVIATATTSGDGNYTFGNLGAGSYSVRVTPPAGLAETFDLDGIGTLNIASFSMAAGQTRTDVDFGYRGTASVGDRVWLDSNGNGAQYGGEAGVNGVTVQLLDNANNVIATAHERRRQLHLRQPGSGQLHRPGRRLHASRRVHSNLRPGRRRHGQPGELRPRRRAIPHRRRFRVPHPAQLGG
jgi:hypothetical protein